MRNIFAPKFASQIGILNLGEFDRRQPVLISDDLELYLPDNLEKIVYFAENKTLKAFAFPAVSQLSCLIGGLIIIIAIALIHLLVDARLRMPRRVDS